MFTGLIETLGTVAEIKPIDLGYRLGLSTGLVQDVRTGESVAVNGVCLTVSAVITNELYVDVSPETARLTTLRSLNQGKIVNIERPLRADGLMGGHFVQGHVDGMGRIERIQREGEHHWLTVEFPESLTPYIVHKGSIAVDGISLTVAGITNNRFKVQLVPYTWENTNLKVASPDELVNIECDIIGKYVVGAVKLAGFKAVTSSQGVIS